MANLESNMTIDNQFIIKEEEQEQEEKFSISLWLFKKRFLIPCLKELTNDFRLFWSILKNITFKSLKSSASFVPSTV